MKIHRSTPLPTSRLIVMASEDLPYLDYSEHMEFYTNGGKKRADTNTFLKEWDRIGNLTLHTIRRNGMNGKDIQRVCDNSKTEIKNCS